MELRGDQGEEIQKLVAAIDENGQEELQAIYTEAESVEQGAGDVLRETWERDVRERKEFFEDQLKNSKLTNIVTSWACFCPVINNLSRNMQTQYVWAHVLTANWSCM